MLFSGLPVGVKRLSRNRCAECWRSYILVMH